MCSASLGPSPINKEELEDAQWFTRAEVDFVINGNDRDSAAFMRPPKTTIARKLLEYWLEVTV